MKIFVTLGTTPFDSLIKYIDENDFFKSHEVLIQSKGNYHPKNFDFFEFSDLIDDIYLESDLIITHAGAGSIYSLLEKRKKIISVPNFERVDKHQKDLSLFLQDKKLALVSWEFDSLESHIISYESGYCPSEYKPTPFFKKNEIIDYLIG
ncbi:hypothetical protein BK412_15985 [Vibrio campbellii]|uniref:PssE/Cps14G family polysaccharide biosynthesis glycosyltransferase n=1 Tax=Vibrio campbellii TaxID=680 RepID=UPI0009C042A3|nr:PssE/Cps14G family polysaccharide biosynthesis glycosyltransferase [Vibrio campbellii]OQQ01860.1 hypothetical protein BK412_15985 [Vibrio campbellii]